MARALLAAGRIAARPGIAPLCRNRVAGIRLGTRLRAVRRGIQALLRHVAGDRRAASKWRRVASSRSVRRATTRPCRAPAPSRCCRCWRAASSKTRSAITSISIGFSGDTARPRCPSRAAVVPALWRRLRMTGGDDSFIVLKHVYSCPSSRRCLRCRGQSRSAPGVPRSRPRSFSARDERADAAEAAGARSAHTASGIAGRGGARAPPGAVDLT